MSETKLPKKLVINQKQTDIGFLDDMGLFVSIYTLELATEVIRRYNSHDALLDARKELVGIIDGIVDGIDYKIDSFTAQPAREAIAEATKEGK